MAHQWFGDYVTLAWWDDTWLNESFASWMETKIVAEWKPEWDLDIEAVAGKSGVMRQDSLDSARAIRQPIDDAGRHRERVRRHHLRQGRGRADDGRAHDRRRHVPARRARVPREARVGQRDVRRLRRRDERGLRARTSSRCSTAFVKQSGVPLVSFDLACSRRRAADARARRSSATSRPARRSIPTRTWTIPVCVRWSAGKLTGRDCTTLTAKTGIARALGEDVPGVGAAERRRGRLLPLAAEGPPARRAARAHARPHARRARRPRRRRQRAGRERRRPDGRRALGLVADLAQDKSRHLVDASIGIVDEDRRHGPRQAAPELRALHPQALPARARASSAGRPSRAKATTPSSCAPSCSAWSPASGKDPTLIAEATKLAWLWLDDHKAVAARARRQRARGRGALRRPEAVRPPPPRREGGEGALRARAAARARSARSPIPRS